MGYYHPLGEQAKLAKMYGVKGVNSPRPGYEGGAMGERRTVNDVERDIRGAMMNDYDTREFLKYNDKVRDKANDISNLRDQNAFIHGKMVKAHKKAGNGGEFSSSNDFAGVAQNSFEDYMSQYKLKGSGKNKQKEEPTEQTTEATPETSYSPEMQQAKERAQNYEQDPASEGTQIFDGSGKNIHKQHDFSKKTFQAA